MFHCDCFIVSKRTDFCGEKFSPFTGRLHVLYDFPAEYFVFLNPVGFIHDAVMRFLERWAAKEVMTTVHKMTIVNVCIIWIDVCREADTISIDRYTIIIPRSQWSDYIVWILCFTRTEWDVLTIYESFPCKAFVCIFTAMKEISCTWFTVNIIRVTVDGFFHKVFDPITYWCLDFFRGFFVFFDSFFVFIFWELHVKKIGSRPEEN